MLRRVVLTLSPPVSLLGILSYVAESTLLVQNEGNQAAITVGIVSLLITRFTGRQ